MIEAIMQRKYPQVEVAATLSQREYEQLAAIPEFCYLHRAHQ